jgi:transposase
MKAYSLDLREKVMAAVAAGKQSNRKLAEAFGISESTIEKWTRRRRETGSVAPSPHAGGTARVLAAHHAFLRAAIKAQPDISLDELGRRLATERHVRVSASMVSRELTELNLPRKKRASTTASGRRRG